MSLRKRSTATAPYHDFHDRNHHRHSKDSGHGHSSGSGSSQGAAEQATITNLMMATTSAEVLQKTLLPTLNLKFIHLYQRTTTRDGVGPDVDVAYSLHIKTWPDWVKVGEEDPEAGPDVHTTRM
jgi:hypothetical protein